MTFTGAAYDDNPTSAGPLTCVGCAAAPSPQNVQFDAGTFEFTAAAVPEPATFFMVGLGILGIAGSRLRRVR